MRRSPTSAYAGIRCLRDAWFLPVTPGKLTFTLLTPVFWYALSALFSPLRYVAFLALGLIVVSYAHRAAFACAGRGCCAGSVPASSVVARAMSRR